MPYRAHPPFHSASAVRGAALAAVVAVTAALGAAWTLLLIDIHRLPRSTAPASAPAGTEGQIRPEPAIRALAGPTDPREVTPPDGDRLAHLLHARWYAAWRSAADGARRLDTCREARLRLRQPCPEGQFRALERAVATNRLVAERARAAYLDHVGANWDAHPA